MDCERAAQLLPDYLHGSLSLDEENSLEKHLDTCAHCKESVTLWNALGQLPDVEPSPAMPARFRAALAAYRQGRAENHQPVWFSGWMSPAFAFAAAILLLVGGFTAGRFQSKERESSPTEISALRSELTGMRQLLVLSMLQQQSASERLQGINWSTQTASADPQILQALLRTLRYDSSVDVRLAALDALSRHAAQPNVRNGMMDALQPRQSPLVQVAVIDLLVEQRRTEAVQQLRLVRDNAEFNPVVRQRAGWAIGKLD